VAWDLRRAHVSLGLRSHPDDAVRTLGEVVLIPIPRPRVRPFDGTAPNLLPGRYPDAGDAPRELLPRHVLRRTLDRLERETGFRLLASFEQEFLYSVFRGIRTNPTRSTPIAGRVCSVRALPQRCGSAGDPDSFLCEYGHGNSK